MPRKKLNVSDATIGQLPERISAENLCLLTGLSDRRHRDLAKTGAFPSPVDSVYELAPTIRGLFEHYRKQADYRKDKKEAIDDEKHRKLKLENDETEGRLTDRAKLAEECAPSVIAIRDLLYQKVANEIPIALAGVDVATGRIISKRVCEELLLRWQDVFKKWKL